MRLELAHINSLNDFPLVKILYKGHPFFFFECVYLSLLYPSNIYTHWLSIPEYPSTKATLIYQKVEKEMYLNTNMNVVTENFKQCP